MKCIFCKCPSDASKSKEHIIPESLGNKEHILSPGWVCDACNNYLARKVEAPFLESWYGQNSRFEMGVQNKKGHYTPGIGMHARSGANIHVRPEGSNIFSIYPAPGEDEERLIESLRGQTKGQLYLPAAVLPPADYDTSRFIAKIGLEVLAYKAMDVPTWNQEIAEKIELDDIRNYVRRGRPGFIWPISIRRIYPADFAFSDALNPEFEVLHEFDIHFIKTGENSSGEMQSEVHAVIAIFGVEYVINLGGPELDVYEIWRKQNGERSYLYSKLCCSESPNLPAQKSDS